MQRDLQTEFLFDFETQGFVLQAKVGSLSLREEGVEDLVNHDLSLERAESASGAKGIQDSIREHFAQRASATEGGRRSCPMILRTSPTTYSTSARSARVKATSRRRLEAR
jgi:hypothetical protein